MTSDSRFDAGLAAKKLLREGRQGALASLMVESGDPYCSLVNVAPAADGAPLLLLSKLALHTKNILADRRASLMLDERKGGDPLEGTRVMLMGALAATGDPAHRAAYLRRHPEAEMFAGFGDFAVYRMQVAKAHLVAGFGRIVDLAARDVLTDLSDAQALVAAEGEAIAHMNGDHAETCRLYATRLLGAADGAWSCVGIDPEGIELQQGNTALRLFFPQRVNALGPLRAVLGELAEKARQRSAGKC
jgi:heme oxygenase (biliverdin-IX-beta and delta-forming)